MADITTQGNATADAELRYTPNGSAVLNFTLAENHRKKVGDQWQDDGTTFYRTTVWGKQAESLVDHIRKGSRVIVTGSFRGGEFEGKQGLVRTYEVTARNVGLVPKAGHGVGYQQPPASAQQSSGWGRAPQGQPDTWGGEADDQRPPF